MRWKRLVIMVALALAVAGCDEEPSPQNRPALDPNGPTCYCTTNNSNTSDNSTSGTTTQQLNKKECTTVFNGSCSFR